MEEKSAEIEKQMNSKYNFEVPVQEVKRAITLWVKSLCLSTNIEQCSLETSLVTQRFTSTYPDLDTSKIVDSEKVLETNLIVFITNQSSLQVKSTKPSTDRRSYRTI